MDEDNRLLTKLDMIYSSVFDYRSVATLGSQGLTARLGAYFFTIAAMPLEIHITMRGA